MKKLILVLFLCLSGCSSVKATPCMPIHDYSPSEQDQIYISTVNLPLNSPLIPALEEWVKLRAEAKACFEAE